MRQVEINLWTSKEYITTAANVMLAYDLPNKWPKTHQDQPTKNYSIFFLRNTPNCQLKQNISDSMGKGDKNKIIFSALFLHKVQHKQNSIFFFGH